MGNRGSKNMKRKLFFHCGIRSLVKFCIVVVLVCLFTGASEHLVIKGYCHCRSTNTACGQSEINEEHKDQNNEPNLANNLFIAVNFSGAYLQNKDLSMKAFIATMFSGGHLQQANFSRSGFIMTDFSGAYLQAADLSGAALVLTNFSGAYLQGANLSGTIFRIADFSGARFSDVSLDGADLAFANLKGIHNWRQIRSIRNTNIYKVRNSPEGFIEWALEHGAVSISPSEQKQKLPSKKP
jgi:uncharacterized protein YjbI with pentapeptide repeats